MMWLRTFARIRRQLEFSGFIFIKYLVEISLTSLSLISVKLCMNTTVRLVERNSLPTKIVIESIVPTNVTSPPVSELPYADIRG